MCTDWVRVGSVNCEDGDIAAAVQVQQALIFEHAEVPPLPAPLVTFNW